MTNLFKKIKSVISKLEGYGSCAHCGLSWNVVDGVYVSYNVKLPKHSGSGMFPICEDCFNKLSVYEILNYCKELLIMWKKEPFYNKNIDFDIIEHNVRYLKENKHEK